MGRFGALRLCNANSDVGYGTWGRAGRRVDFLPRLSARLFDEVTELAIVCVVEREEEGGGFGEVGRDRNFSMAWDVFTGRPGVEGDLDGRHGGM